MSNLTVLEIFVRKASRKPRSRPLDEELRQHESQSRAREDGGQELDSLDPSAQPGDRFFFSLNLRGTLLDES